MIPKYSIVLPTFNGVSTLSVTLPAMLRFSRDDIEFVISDNVSDDGTYDFLRSFDDTRIRVFQPDRRLSIGQHLEFTYLHARGQWQGHLGDDDYFMPDRFDLLDRAVDENHDVDTVRGGYVRYIWPTPEGVETEERDNSIDPKFVTGTSCILPGKDVFRESINTEDVEGGGSWIVRREVIEEIRQKAGWFSSPQHLEFFGMRSAVCHSRFVCIFDTPIYVIGRHVKSSASQAIAKNRLKKQTFDWNQDDPLPWKHCPWQYKSYATISLDGALLAIDKFAPDLKAEMNWTYWVRAVENSLASQIANGHMDKLRGCPAFWKGILQIPGLSPIEWIRLIGRHSGPLHFLWRLLKPFPSQSIFEEGRGWSDRIYGRDAGFSNIMEAAEWAHSFLSKNISNSSIFK